MKRIIGGSLLIVLFLILVVTPAAGPELSLSQHFALFLTLGVFLLIPGVLLVWAGVRARHGLQYFPDWFMYGMAGPPKPKDDAVVALRRIYRLNPQGFVAGQNTAEELEIRAIWARLYERGGIELMREVHAEFAQSAPPLGAARNLEFLWDGIGQWQG